MTPSSPESLTSSFVSLSLSQARSRSSHPPESSENEEFIVLERSTLSPTTSSTGGARGGRNVTSESSSSGFSLVQAQEADQEEKDEEEAVARWLLHSPRTPSRGPSTPVSSSHHSGRLEHQGGSVSSSSDHEGSSASGSQAGGSRRARQRVRARARAAQSRRDAAAEGRDSSRVSSPPSTSSASSNYEVGPTRPWGDEDSEREDEDEVDSVLGSEMTEEDATDVVDAFLANSAVFVLQGDNGKLQLWQALCVELGLCLPPNSSSYASTSSASSRSRSNSTSSSTSTDSDRTTTQATYHSFPTSLTQANKLLKAHAFVNLREYFATRASVGDGTSSQGGEGSETGAAGYGGGSGSGRRSRVSTEEGRRVRNAALMSLKHPNKNALRRYTQKHRLYVKLGAAKEAWLQPLLIDMFFNPQHGGRA